MLRKFGEIKEKPYICPRKIKKINLMNRYIAYFGVATTLTLCGMMSSCSNKEISELDIPRELYFEEDGHFDFATTRSVALDVNYGAGLGALSLVEVYEELPEDGTEAEPLYQAVTDEQGCFKTRIKLPTRVEQVWLVNHRFGMPEFVQCEVQNGRIAYRYERAEGYALAPTRAASEYNQYVSTVDKGRNLYSIVSWSDQFGNIAGHPLVSTDKKLSSQEYTTYVSNLQYLLWGSTTTKKKNNSNLALGGDIVNTKVLDKMVNAEGRLVEVESASLSLVFMNEGGWNQNVVGYYYYPTANPPKRSGDVKKYICLPNSSKPSHFPYGGGNSSAYHQSGEAPAYAGESVQLLFENPDGSFTPNFPPGYTIGYFIIANGFRTVTDQNNYKGDPYNPGKVDAARAYYFSNEEWNSSSAKRYIALSLPDGSIVYGVEDGSDNSFEDVLFMIQGSPNEAIKNEEIPSIDPDNKILYYKDHAPVTYAFEDQWPQGGDYDLNDVVIGHERIIEYKNDAQNSVRSIEDKFTLKGRSASYSDGFAVQLNKNFLGTLTITNSAGEDITSRVRHYTDDQNDGCETYILFEDLQQLREGDQFVIRRTYESAFAKTTFEKAESSVNPFVISQFTEAAYLAGNMIEIHIPDSGNRTCKATSAGCSDDRYFYVERKGNNYYPYAISIPEKHFVSSAEKVCIDKTYPNFDAWVRSKGTTNKDWYK